MKYILLFIGFTSILFSCKKERFDLGIYEMTLTWSETINDETKEFESTRLLNFLSETENLIEIKSFSGTSVFLDKKGSKITGDLPVSYDYTNIDGHKSPFSSNIKGTFSTFKYVTQGSGPMLTYEYKFKMIKQ